jgi:hypothetical protein
VIAKSLDFWNFCVILVVYLSIIKIITMKNQHEIVVGNNNRSYVGNIMKSSAAAAVVILGLFTSSCEKDIPPSGDQTEQTDPLKNIGVIKPIPQAE